MRYDKLVVKIFLITLKPQPRQTSAATHFHFLAPTPFSFKSHPPFVLFCFVLNRQFTVKMGWSVWINCFSCIERILFLLQLHLEHTISFGRTSEHLLREAEEVWWVLKDFPFSQQTGLVTALIKPSEGFIYHQTLQESFALTCFLCGKWLSLLNNCTSPFPMRICLYMLTDTDTLSLFNPQFSYQTSTLYKMLLWFSKEEISNYSAGQVNS